MNTFVLAMLDRDPGQSMLTILHEMLTISVLAKRPSVQAMLLSRYVKTHMHRFVKERTL
jgi:hypothetical protein